MIKKTSWLYVLLSPSRWIEVPKYILPVKVKLGAGDRPDPRDLDAGEIYDSSRVARLPEKVSRLDEAKKLGWLPTKQSKNSCTAYSKGNGVEITNTIEHQEPVSVDKELQWSHQEENGASRDSGDLIQNAEYCFHKNPQGFPQTEYRRMRNAEDTVYGAKKWLAMGIGRNIRTGIYWKWSKEHRNTNSGYMKETGFFIPGEGARLGGHATAIVGYDDNKECPDGSKGAFELFEPELETWGNNEPGNFWVSYEDFGSLFSKYISRDCIDSK